MACAMQWISAGMGGAFATGFTALEIDAGCRLTGIAKTDRPVVSQQVREMGRVSANEANSRKA